MAGPFHYFRKHQKPLIAAAAVLCMVIFVFSDALVGLIRNAAGGGGTNRTAGSIVATWDGGVLSERDLAILRSRRYFLSEFLRRLEITGAQRAIADGETPTKPTIPDLILPENTTTKAVEMSVVTSRVFAAMASRTGIRVSDEVINHYLREAGFRRVGGDEIVAMLKSFRIADRQATVEVLFDSLRDNLLANTYQNSIAFASQTILPEQRWEDWRRVNDRIALEAAILPSQAMVADVPEPGDAEIRAFYEKYKDQEGGRLMIVKGTELPSPAPGFAQPRKVRLHYLLGDVFSWSEKLQETVSDAEIEDYYQRNKRTQFVQADTSMAESTETSEPAPNDAGSAPGVSEPGASQAGPEGQSESQQEALVEQSTDDTLETGDTSETGDMPETEPEAGEPAETGDTSETEPEAGEPAETGDTLETEPEAGEPADGGTTEEDGPADKTGSLRKHNPFRLIAMQADDAAEEGEVSEEAPEEEIKYQPLEEVRDQIRRQLATEKAVAQLKTTIDRIFTRLRTAYNPYGEQRAIAKAQGSELPVPPKQLTSLTNLAKEYGLTYEETPLLSGMQLARESLVGKAMDAQTGRASVTQRMLGRQDLYDPLLAKDIDGNWYVVIKVEDVPRHVPQLDEIRAEVISAWKAWEASKLALEKANGWAVDVQANDFQASGGSFSDFFRDKQLADSSKIETVTTDLFSWLTYGAMPAEMQQGPRLGDAPPLVAVGDDFMTKAFELKEGEVKVLQNYDRSQTYIARLHQRQQSEEQLRKLFLTEANSWFGARYATAGRWQQFQRQVFGQLTERVGLEFEEGWGQTGPQ